MTRSALIVDDQPDIRKLIMMTMRAEGFELHEADNGEDAWRIARNLRPSIVLLDAMMPGSLDGYQVCEKIKNSPMLQLSTKVVMLTARGLTSDMERGHAAGCDAYMVKPFSPLALLELVDRLVS